MILSSVAAVPVVVWAYLIGARGGFWRVPHGPERLPPPQSPSDAPARIVAVIPARDEADVIGDAICSLLRQQFRGSLEIIVVDDGSTDRTADVAREAAASVQESRRLTVIAAGPLPAGWSGKVWAMSRGAAVAIERDPEFLLFTDADVHHAIDNIAGLVARARVESRDLVSYMVRLSTATFAERCLIPAFIFFFFKLYPPAWIASRRTRVAGAAGGCMLVRPAALARAGGLESIRGEIIDDCALARIVKGSGGSIWLGLTQSASSTRRYGSFAEIAGMISRTAFNQLRHSHPLLAATLLGLFCTYLLPPLLLASGTGSARLLGLLAWALMALAYLPMLRFYRVSPLWSLVLPAIAAFYAAATLRSAWDYHLGSGGAWKGRIQDRPVGSSLAPTENP